jgi:hypothetical protein
MLNGKQSDCAAGNIKAARAVQLSGFLTLGVRQPLPNMAVTLSWPGARMAYSLPTKRPTCPMRIP